MAAQGVAVDPELLQQATNSLAHRGPDDSGCVVLGPSTPERIEVGLGHRRLAILDLSPLGHQPMHDPQSGNWIVFNGEIYNFREIRHELESKGFVFQSRSDTEVLLKAYAFWGRDCLGHLRGIFAFAIWDARNASLFLARDHMGVKPLYYAERHNCFVFASEIRALLKTGLVPAKLDRDGLFSFLSFGSIYEPATAIKGVYALQAGHFLTWKSGRVNIERYWDPPTATSSMSAGDAKSRVIEAVDESIRMQTVSDVPAGVFLSGGIDSSAITAVLSRSCRPTTFSVVFGEQEFNEAPASRMVAQRFKTDHHEIFCSEEDGLALSHDAISAMDQPSIDGLNTYLICGVARKAGIKVVLSGLGGDELFCGYQTFRSVPRMERFSQFWHQVPGRIVMGDLLFSGRVRSDFGQKIHALVTENGRLVHPYFLARALFTPAKTRSLLRNSPEEDMLQPLKRTLGRTAVMDSVNRVSYLESRCYMLNTLLRDSDAMSMAHGLELRVPLIDHRLAETMFSIPGPHKLDRNVPKPFLVRAVQAELPDQIIHRRKRGFTFPFERWLRNQMRAEVEQSISGIGDGPLNAVINCNAAIDVWRDFHACRTWWSRPWSLHVLEQWCERNGVAADR
jgi:asparagine synthase (glutamine-hydrolysing)